MKKRIMIMMTLFVALLLCACAQPEPISQIRVGIVESAAFTVEENGIMIQPGQDAVFRLKMEAGNEITDVAYDGDYTLQRSEDAVILVLQQVRYPARIRIDTSSTLKHITYDANGGQGQAVTMRYDISAHPRPNTAIGTDFFSREGYTLVAWNTHPDGSGTRIGLGSRVTVSDQTHTLYAQWDPWTPTDRFAWEENETGLTILRYSGSDRTVVVPEQINGKPVTCIGPEAFIAASAERIVLPKTLQRVEDGAFRLSALRELVLFDNIEYISDAAFQSCNGFTTLYINAVEDPYGYQYRRESLLADKVDLLICAQGKRKLVCYGGCSMWYNLDGKAFQQQLGDSYCVINMGLNGTVNSLIQMEIMLRFMEPGDVLFHTPELFSQQQLLLDTGMDEGDDKLWCGLEYNYDLLTYVDISKIDGLFDSFRNYLDMKEPGGDYQGTYTDSRGCYYMDRTGSVPFLRTQTAENFGRDLIELEPEYLRSGLPALGQMYQRFIQKDIQVLLSYACVNMDGVPAAQRHNVDTVDELFCEAAEKTPGVQVVSTLRDYLFWQADMYDTHYHLLTTAAQRNTQSWLRDLLPYLDIK